MIPHTAHLVILQCATLVSFTVESYMPITRTKIDFLFVNSLVKETEVRHQMRQTDIACPCVTTNPALTYNLPAAQVLSGLIARRRRHTGVGRFIVRVQHFHTAPDMSCLARWKSRGQLPKLPNMTTVRPEYSSTFNLPQKRENPADLHSGVPQPDFVATGDFKNHVEEVQQWISRGAERELTLEDISAEDLERLDFDLISKGIKLR